jgi:hypothetical protein
MTSSAYSISPPAAATPTARTRLWRGGSATPNVARPAYPMWPQATSGAGGGNFPLDPRRSRQGVSGLSGGAALLPAPASAALAFGEAVR